MPDLPAQAGNEIPKSSDRSCPRGRNIAALVRSALTRGPSAIAALLFTRDKRVLARVPQPAHDEGSDGAPVSRGPENRAVTSTSPVPSKFHVVEMRTLAKAALQQAGFRAAIAKRAVDIACAHVGTNTDLTGLIKEALRHCG